MRLSRPVYSGHKTRGEVAALAWLRRFGDFPTPYVRDFDDSTNNEMGLEWVLIDLIPGEPLKQQWREMSLAKKVTLAIDFAEVYAKIINGLKSTFKGIGTLDDDRTTQQKQERGMRAALLDPEGGCPVAPNEMVCPELFGGDIYSLHPRGRPYRSSNEWLDSLLNAVIKKWKSKASGGGDNQERKDAEFGLKVARKLHGLLGKIFPDHPDLEETFLCHDNVSLKNILVTEEGKFTGLVGWECATTRPRWAVIRVPDFLLPRLGKGPGQPAKKQEPAILEEYEKTHMRGMFHEKMEKLCPGWKTEFDDGTLKRDFLNAARCCLNGTKMSRIDKWVNYIESGESPCFATVMENDHDASSFRLNEAKRAEAEEGL